MLEEKERLITQSLMKRKAEIDDFLEKLLTEEKNKVLSSVLDNNPNRAEVISSITELFAAMSYSLLYNGKRIRACLVLEIATILAHNTEEYDGDSKHNILCLAAAIELVHCYSLIHDDLPAMDNDDYRRGRLSCHRQYGEATALLAGNALLVMAFHILSNITSSKLAITAIQELGKASGYYGMILGQMIDIKWQQSQVPSIDLTSYHAFILNKLKTGALFALSCLFGGLAAGAEEAVLRSLEAIGNNFGILYQIVDDVDDDNIEVNYSLLSHVEEEIDKHRNILIKTVNKSSKVLSLGDSLTLDDIVTYFKTLILKAK